MKAITSYLRKHPFYSRTKLRFFENIFYEKNLKIEKKNQKANYSGGIFLKQY